MDSKVIHHRCPRMDGYTTSGIVDFETDEEGYTTARCRGCGANLSQAIVLDERLLGVLPKVSEGSEMRKEEASNQ